MSNTPSTPFAVSWIGGLTALLAWLAGRFLPYQGEAFDQAAYFFLGAGLPLAALALYFAPKRLGVAIQSGLADLFPVLTAMVLRAHWSPMLLVLAALQVVVAKVTVRGEEPRSFGVMTAGVFAGWLAAAGLLWWRNWGQLETEPLAWLILALLIVAVTYACFEKPRSSIGWRRFRHGAWVVWAALFALASSRLQIDIGHGGFLAGVIGAQRQGGWLLWDVPSQYGFLSLLFLSWIPAADPWQSVVIGNSLLLWVSAVVLHRRLLGLLPGPVGAVVAGALAFAAVLMIPGWAPDIIGPNRMPSVGAFRFIWSYLLLELVVEVHSQAEAETRRRRLLFLGCVGWVLGCLWSSESALASSAIWLPGYAWTVWHRPVVKNRASSLALPFGFGAVAFAAIWLIYRVRLGHGPDWVGFADYLRTYQAGFGALVANWNGAVSFLVGALALAGAGAVLVLRWSPQRLAVSLGAIALIVTCSSYFVLRSHESNASNLVPLLLLGAVTAVFIVPEELGLEVAHLKLGLVPFLVVPLFGAYGEWPKVSRYFGTLVGPHLFSDVQQTLPTMPDEVKKLLQRAGIDERTPIVVVQQNLLSQWRTNFWLPLAPAGQFSILPEDRRTLYLERFTERVKSGGWILVPRLFDEVKVPMFLITAEEPMVSPRLWLLPRLAKTHRVARELSSENWVLLQVERMPP